MLKLGIIGYGHRIRGMVSHLGDYDLPFSLTAVADPAIDPERVSGDPMLANATIYPDADSMLSSEKLDGVMVGTRCMLHTEMACKVAAHNLPVFLEKPVAITFEQLALLRGAFAGYQAPTVVSFPLRLSPIVQRVKELIEADTIGTVEQVIAVNDVPYGGVYYYRWYRDYALAGGLWLQKATHDLDYIAYLLGQRPTRLAAMMAQRVYGGEKPFDLHCADCDEVETCPESPFNLYYQRFQGDQVEPHEQRMCLFSEGIRNQDMGSCLLAYENGAQASYTQNMFARLKAARRGARLYGYKGTIDFDWYANTITVYYHQRPDVDTIDFSGSMSHFGGDRELILDWLRAMRDGSPSRSPMSAGIESALTCLWARDSAESGRFCDIAWPD